MLLILRRLIKQVFNNSTPVATEAFRKRCQVFEAQLQASLAMLQMKIWD
jgi:hypothetical protein